MPAVATAGGLPNRLGKYELLLPLAAGGMARIYIGRSTGIGSFERHVVLKLITPERANDHTAVQMFLDEARLAASLNHQNVAQVFEVGEDLGIHYLAMEYVHGQDLRALLAKAGSQGMRIPLELALTVSAGAAAGLNHAHERRGSDGQPLGIVHRDVSPSNIMIGYDGAVKLLDFGIAKATHRSVETQSGIIKGKFAYMAPEQCRGRDVDRRSDVFSLGIILYEITTQHRCFRADSDFDTMHRIVTGDVVRPTRLIQGYPQALEAIVMKALAVDANQRYQSAGLLLEAIESFAVSARMAMSTMSLGRFMRETFGEVQEPWLQQNRNVQPVQAKESTISSTDGRSNVSAPAIGRALSEGDLGIPDSEARFPDSGSVQGRTVLDLPRRPGDQENQEPAPAEWNAKSYPQMQPAIASNTTLPPDAMIRTYQMQSPLPPPAVGPHPNLPTPPQGHQQQVPSGQFTAVPGSGSHSSPAMPAIPSTRHGYASGAQQTNDLSYPRYEPPAADLSDMQLKPNRRPLFIGLGIAVLGFIIIIAVALGGDAKTDEQAAPSEGSSVGSATEPAIVKPARTDLGSAAPAKGSAIAPIADKQIDAKGSGASDKHDTGSAADDKHPGSAAEVVVEDTITLSIDSDPHGADVILGGKTIGTTPLIKKYKRASGISTLTIHKAGYVDVTTRMDLGGDFSKPKVELKKAEDHVAVPVPMKDKATPVKNVTESHKANTSAVDTHKHTTSDTPPEHKTPHPATDTPKPKPKPKCQPPSQYNPFDTSCDNGPCPVCK